MNEGFVKDLIKKGQSSRIEFQKNAISLDIEDTVSAFANTDGGYIIFGVDDEGVVVGIPFTQLKKSIDQLKAISHSMSVESEIYTVEIDEKFLIIYSIQKNYIGFNIRTSNGLSYLRAGDKNIVDFKDTRPRKKKGQKQFICFVAMSFREQEYPRLVDYYDAMKRAVERCNYNIKVEKNDEDPFNGDAVNRILEKIKNCHFMIADYTLNSSNVYYEEGYAAGKDKEIIQTVENGTDIAFDINHNNTYTYANAHQLEEQLVLSFNEICKRLNSKK